MIIITDGFRRQTHFPALPRVYRASRDADYYRQFDQVLHLSKSRTAASYFFALADCCYLAVRNPIDAISSWYHLANAPRTAEGFQNHEDKGEASCLKVAQSSTFVDGTRIRLILVALPGGKFSDLQRDSLLDLAERWARHAIYWSQAPILTHTLRYEDLKATPIPQVRVWAGLGNRKRLC